MKPDEKVMDCLNQWQEEHLHLLTTLARIPAPSHHEEQRADFCKQWLEGVGAEGVYIDGALNVIYPIGVTEENPLVVFAAHSDVVFPDETPLPLTIEDGRICCPGIGDDTACVAALLMAAKYIASNRLQPKDHGVLLVINSCEEGLGNLKGTKQLFGDFGSRIREFITFDGRQLRGVDQAVGSKRYQVEIETEGGHSYGSFGNRNAIACLAELIGRLYAQPIPPMGKTTYNVGTICGGTSVNTIAQQAEMLYEFRSDCRESLAIMQQQFDAALEQTRAQGITVNVTKVGDRPCSGDVDPDAMAALKERAQAASMEVYDKGVDFISGSTDCNVPLSMGIPAICVGCYEGSGAHTRQEYVLLDSLLPGLQFTLSMVLHSF